MIAPGDAHPEHVIVGHELAHPGQRFEGARRDRAGEPELDLVMGQVTEPLDRVELHDPPLADDRDPVAALLDLGQDVARQEDGATVADRLTQGLEERLLDERVETRRRLVEDQQLGPVLEGDDHPDLLLVALAVLPEAPADIQLEAVDQRRLVRGIDAATKVARSTPGSACP